MGETVVHDRAGRLAREAVQRRWTGVFAPARHIDWLLLLAALVLTAFGLLMIFSATYARLEQAGVDPRFYVNRQMLALVIGVAGMAAIAIVDYRVYRAWALVGYGATLLILVFVLLAGQEINGARAWIVLGPLQFQPSELAKVIVIVVLAAHFHDYREDALGVRALREALAFAALPMGLILLQPDFGTFIVFVAIVFGVLLLARVHVRYMVALVALGLLAIVGALQLNLVKDYQVARLTAFINPATAASTDDANLQQVAYNVRQAQIAVGAGQLFGQGLFQGTQTTLSFVPENQTDFIFTVVGEQTGFFGSALLLATFGILLWRGLRIALLSRDTFGMLIAGGVVAVFAFQLFINVGMAIGIMPVTGLPLPFISYGGTSLIASWVMIGLLQNVHMRRFVRARA